MKLEISFIDLDKNNRTPKKMIQRNLISFFYTKLYKLIKTSSFIERINICHLSYLFVDTKKFICQFDRF